MNIYIASKKSKLENIQKKYPSAFILDITSTSDYGGLRILSPFYPHGNIPIPGMNGRTATCVEAVWQGLKVFENCGVDYSTFNNNTMKNIKRSIRKYGKPLGHKYGEKLLNYKDARWMIYLPTYKYVLDNIQSVRYTLKKIKEKLKECDIVFLDYNTNCNITDYSKPLSHAGLVKLYIEDNYPVIDNLIRDDYENKTIKSSQMKDVLIETIKSHEKYKEKKHGNYIEQIKKMENINIDNLIIMSGSKKDGWKTIIKEIAKLSVTKQLSLFI